MKPRIIRLSLEQLEDRWAPAVRTWTGGGLNDLWSNPANWDGGVPAGGDDVVIPATLDSTEVIFDNSVTGGAVSLSSLTSDEPFRVTAAPASSATLTLEGPGPFSFNSALTISGGAINGNGTIAVNGSLTLTGGTLGGTGTFNVGGLTTWSGGAMTGVGITNANGGLIMSGSPSSSRRINNSGVATYNGLANEGFSNSGGTFNNLPTGVFTIEGNNDIIRGLFNNEGTFIKRAGVSGDGITRFFLTRLNNSGRLELHSGTLSLEGDGAHTGDFDIAAGATLQFGGSGLNLFNAGADVTSAGLVRQASNEFSGVSFQAGSSYTVSGATEVISGGLLFDITVNAPTLVVAGGRFGGSGTFNVSGLTTWSGGVMTGAGVTNANGGLIMTGQLALTGGRILNNSGLATYDGVANQNFSNGGAINNLATGTFTIVGNNDINASVFRNFGTFIKQAGAGGDGVTSFSSLRNSGIVELQSGTLFPDPGAVNTGAVTIGSSGTLVTVAYGQDAGNTTLAGGTIKATGNPGVGIRGGSLTGWGAINAKVENSGGQVSPGLSPGTIGTFAINGQYNQTAGALNIDVGGPIAGTQFDQLHVVGATGVFAVGVGGALNISLDGGFSPNIGDTFMIINNDGPFAVAGTFAGLPEGATFLVGGTLFGISYVGGTGNDVVLTALTAANSPPADVVLSLNAAVDETGTATLSGSFTDPDAGDTHTVVIDWGPSEGTTTLTLAAGVTTFTATHTYLDDNPSGTSFDVYIVSATVTEPAGNSASGSAAITVNNLVPTALDDSAVTNEDQAVVIDVLSNDFDPAGPLDPRGIDSVTHGAKGAAVIDTKGNANPDDDQVIYTPNPGATGTDSFTYTISDDDGGTATATVNVQIRNLVDVAGRVFNDQDNNGAYEPGHGDSDLGGVLVQLYDETSGSLITSRTTAADGTYFFDVNLGPGTYRIAAAQPAGFLDGREIAGNLGGAVDNTQDSNQMAGISVGTPGTTADAIDYLFAEIRPSQTLGIVWSDANNDGEVNFGETVIPGVAIELTGVDDRGQAVNRAATTDPTGVYAFLDLRPSDLAGYTIREIQPAGYEDGLDILGTVNGVSVGSQSGNDAFAGVVLSHPNSLAENYNFGERPLTEGGVTPGQTATIGYWQNNNGQRLIHSLNGGQASTQLGDWLAVRFPNMYGASAGANNLAGKTNAEVAAFYKVLFARTARTAAGGGPPKMDAQVMATALAVYVTNQSLAGTTAAAYGFLVTETGVGTRTFNVGSSGAAFGLADYAEVTVLDLLLAVDARSKNGLLFDLDGDGAANASLETIYRTMANEIFSGINETGDN